MIDMADNASLLTEVASAIDDFLAGRSNLDFIQAKLQTAMSLLERPAIEAINAIRLAEADLEEIQFTVLREDQPAAAARVLEELRPKLVLPEENV